MVLILFSITSADPLDPLPFKSSPFNSSFNRIFTENEETEYKTLLSQYVQYSIASKIGRHNHRFSTFKTVMNLLIERNAKVLLEIGTARNGNKSCEYDGCSTIIFAEFVQFLNAKLYSVDKDINACNVAKIAVEKFSEYVEIVNSDSVEYLNQIKKGKIDFLYLDGVDFTEENYLDSQWQVLKEIEAGYRKLHTKSVVLLDDCGLAKGGSCALAKEFLMQKGWTLLSGFYQQVFVFQK